jgi:hypothetical protein
MEDGQDRIVERREREQDEQHYLWTRPGECGTKKNMKGTRRCNIYLHFHTDNSMGKQLVVFDFDWSFVDQDTDRWVFEVLSTELRRLLQDRKKGQGTGIQCTPDVV